MLVRRTKTVNKASKNWFRRKINETIYKEERHITHNPTLVCGAGFTTFSKELLPESIPIFCADGFVAWRCWKSVDCCWCTTSCHLLWSQQTLLKVERRAHAAPCHIFAAISWVLVSWQLYWLPWCSVCLRWGLVRSWAKTKTSWLLMIFFRNHSKQPAKTTVRLFLVGHATSPLKANAFNGWGFGLVPFETDGSFNSSPMCFHLASYCFHMLSDAFCLSFHWTQHTKKGVHFIFLYCSNY